MVPLLKTFRRPAAFGVAFAFWTILVFSVPGITILDQAVYHWFSGWQSPAWLGLNARLTDLGDAWFILPFLFLAAIVVFIRSRSLDGAFFFATACLALSVNGGIKWAFGRERPKFFVENLHLTHLSYPSGHALGAMLLAWFLSWVVDQKARPQNRRTLKACIWFLALWIALSRIFLGVHWMSDVIGGILSGFFWIQLKNCLLKDTRTIE